MLDTTILGDILDELKTYTGALEAIFSDQAGKKPKEPYITMKMISDAGDSSHGIIIRNNVPSENPDFEYDVEETLIEFPQVTLSINAYSKDMDEAKTIASQCRDWFKFSGYDFLKEKDIVVVRIETLQNRDALLVTDYERKWGFDVIIRVKEELKRRTQTIERFEIQKGE